MVRVCCSRICPARVWALVDLNQAVGESLEDADEEEGKDEYDGQAEPGLSDNFQPP